MASGGQQSDSNEEKNGEKKEDKKDVGTISEKVEEGAFEENRNTEREPKGLW